MFFVNSFFHLIIPSSLLCMRIVFHSQQKMAPCTWRRWKKALMRGWRLLTTSATFHLEPSGRMRLKSSALTSSVARLQGTGRITTM